MTFEESMGFTPRINEHPLFIAEGIIDCHTDDWFNVADFSCPSLIPGFDEKEAGSSSSLT